MTAPVQRAMPGLHVRIRMTESQHAVLRAHLFPGDGLEAVAMLVCGRAGTSDDEVVVVHEVVPIPHAECAERTPVRVTWPTDRIVALATRAAKYSLALIKVHGHPGGCLRFSEWDDNSDRALFPSLHGWVDSDRPLVSAVMIPDGTMAARVVTEAATFNPVESIMVVGARVQEIGHVDEVANVPTEIERRAGVEVLDGPTTRTRQTLGSATTDRLATLSVGVVGCSGTGSWVIELLSRMGVGELVLIDPDSVEYVNLNRIIHATIGDAKAHRSKVDVLADAVAAMGTGVQVEAHASSVLEPQMVRRLSRCDAIMGCVDSIDARDLLGRISTYYVLPYVDVGVRLVADGRGGITHIVGSAQYVHPESLSLLDRGLYTAKQLADAGLRRSDPSAFSNQVQAKYISNANEVRPAVASVNAFYASLAVNELLARLHPFRDDDSGLGVTISLSQLRIIIPESGSASPGISKRIGRGDAIPLLGLPILSE